MKSEFMVVSQQQRSNYTASQINFEKMCLNNRSSQWPEEDLNKNVKPVNQTFPG